jgi:hypothetical protein
MVDLTSVDKTGNQKLNAKSRSLGWSDFNPYFWQYWGFNSGIHEDRNSTI